MKSFRTEIENPVVEQDIIELEKKIFQTYGLLNQTLTDILKDILVIDILFIKDIRIMVECCL